MSDAEQPADSEAHEHHDHGDVEGPGYATPQAAIEEADREKTAYVMGLHVGQDVDAPDFLAVVDPDSDTYGDGVARERVDLTVGETVVDTELVYLDPGENETIEFSTRLSNPGEYAVAVAGEQFDAVTVANAATTTQPPTTAETTQPPTTETTTRPATTATTSPATPATTDANGATTTAPDGTTAATDPTTAGTDARRPPAPPRPKGRPTARFPDSGFRSPSSHCRRCSASGTGDGRAAIDHGGQGWPWPIGRRVEVALTPSSNESVAYDAILFDNDGVLTTPNELTLLRESARAAFEDVGVTDPPASHVENLAIDVDPDWFEDVCGEYDLDPATFWYWRDRNAALAQRTEIREGRKDTYDDVAVLESLAYDLGIVSTNQHETIEFILEYFDLDGLFGTYYGREATVTSLHRKKPDPHYLDRAIRDLDADHALYVGDSESDVRAAHNAGLDSAFVRRPHRTEYALSVEPTYEIAGLDELSTLLSRDADARHPE